MLDKKGPDGDDRKVNNLLNRESYISDLGFCRVFGEAPSAAVTSEGVFGQRGPKIVTAEGLFGHPFGAGHFVIYESPVQKPDICQVLSLVVYSAP